MRILSMVLMGGLAGPGWAMEEVALTTRVEAIRTMLNEYGEEERRLVATEAVGSGDELRYTITFTNVTADQVVPADSTAISTPVPEQAEYLEGTAFGVGTKIEFSVDGGHSWGRLELLAIVVDGGTQAAVAADITHVRWTLVETLRPGQQGSVHFHVILL